MGPGRFDPDFSYSLPVTRLHPTELGSKTPNSSIPWPLGARKSTGGTLDPPPWHPDTVPRGLEGSGVARALHHPKDRAAAAACVPFHRLTEGGAGNFRIN